MQKKSKEQLDDIKNNFKMFIQYRGKSTEHYAHALHNLEVPCTVVMTLRKAKTVLTSLKPPVEKENCEMASFIVPFNNSVAVCEC